MKQLINGWQQCYYHFLAWWYLLQEPYSHFATWEFFTYMNPDANETYVVSLSAADYDSLIEKLNEPPDPKVIESIKKLISRPAPWD